MPDTRTNEELSAEVARRLFGKFVELYETPNMSWWAYSEGIARGVRVIDYASDHNAAMRRVVPEMRKRGYGFGMNDWGTGMQAYFFRPTDEITHKARSPFGEEPRAICEAALAALDAEGETK